MDEDLKLLEEELGKLSPLGMPEDLLTRLDQAMCRWHESVPAEEKIVSMSELSHLPSQIAESPAHRSQLFPRLASAAAVAALGIFSAHIYFENESRTSGSTLADIHHPASPHSSHFNQIPASGLNSANFTPVSATTDVVGTADRGIVYLANGQPARCLAIHYQDQLEYRNDKGELLKLNKPELKVIYIPLKTD